MGRNVVRLAAILCGAAAFASGLPAVAQTYRITNLGSVAPGWAFVALNNSGQLAGNYTPPGQTFMHGFIYANGVLTDIGTLGGSASAQAQGMNNLGQVTGTSNGHAFIYSNGVMTDIGTLVSGLFTVGKSINDAGQVTGTGYTSNASPPVPQQTTNAFVYSNGVMTAIPGAISAAGLGINNSGAVVGAAGPYGGSDPFLYENGTLTDLTPNAPPDYGDPGTGAATAINNSGQIVGQMRTADRNPFHAFIYSNGQITDLSPAHSCCTFDVATGINNQGQVLLTLNEVANLYSNGVTQTLSSLVDPTDPLAATTVFQGGVAINDNGWILVNGYNTPNSDQNSYLLTPQTLSVTPAPLAFGNQPVGTVSAAQSVAVTNKTTSSIPIASITPAGDFAIANNNCTATLAPGASCTVGVTFAPTAVDSRTGTLSITADTVYDVSLSGTGTLAVNLASSASTSTVGVPVTLTWSGVSLAGETCVASGGVSGDGWTGQLFSSGSMAVTESAAGKFTYTFTCTAGSQSATGQVVVTDTVPTVSLSANPTNLTVGQATTLTWTAANATTCTASGNGTGDGWTGTKPASGTATITESTTGLITYTLTCTSGPQSAQSSVQVFNNAKSSGGGSGGGGALGLVSLGSMLGILLLRTRRLVTAGK
jgi:probable HAF family extracellular repeat protein